MIEEREGEYSANQWQAPPRSAESVKGSFGCFEKVKVTTVHWCLSFEIAALIMKLFIILILKSKFHANLAQFFQKSRLIST